MLVADILSALKDNDRKTFSDILSNNNIDVDENSFIIEFIDVENFTACIKLYDKTCSFRLVKIRNSKCEYSLGLL